MQCCKIFAADKASANALWCGVCISKSSLSAASEYLGLAIRRRERFIVHKR